MKAAMPKTVPKERLLSEVDYLLSSVPTDLAADTAEVVAWIGRLKSTLHTWDSIRSMSLVTIIGNLGSPYYGSGARRDLLTLLYEARHDLQMVTGQSLNVAVGQGEVFSYFDALRKVLETAQSDLLVIDPYLEPSFLGDYLVHVRPQVTVRLLTRKNSAQLAPSVRTYGEQHRNAMQLRSTGKLHDRYVLIDGKACYQSGASFSTGARNASTTLTEIVDTFAAVQATYEALWTQATVVF
jgi:hypothetical protein